jgi:ribosomal protein L24E
MTAELSRRARINMYYWQYRFAMSWLLVLTFLCAGCGRANSDSASGTTSKTSNAAGGTTPAISPSETHKATSRAKPKFEAVTLGGDTAKSQVPTTSAVLENEQMESVIAAMQPLQVMLGKWRGTTNKAIKGSHVVDEQEWIWDFKTDRKQPALVVKSDKNPYIREGRLTYLPTTQQFQFAATTPEGAQHVMTGKFEREPEDVTGDDNKPQKTYQLLVTEIDPQDADAWQVAFDQQENNRYLLKVSRRRGQGYQLVDTVGTQRLGTSVAANDEDYGERKCIISGGLGTMTVSHNGNTYWVCCTGCQAAFNDDPKRWLAKMAEADKAKKP